MAGFPKPGEMFGRYQVVRQIGRGGMGAVFEATDPVLHRSVAIKIVLPNLTDDESYRERFAREAAVLAQLRSRHILQIHEYGEHEDALYLVTEFFPDGDLQSWLGRNGPLDRNAALTLVAQVCEGLYDAHEAGVVHRDVKPSNVLLWERKGRLIPYLCDFGIATSESHRLTRTGTMIGSLPYMAPERHLGDPADQRGDIYSAGCLLLAVLTGDAPFSGSDFQVMEAHIRQPVPQLDMADDLDVAINKVLAKALQKNPDDRYPDAAAFERALNRLIQPGSREQGADQRTDQSPDQDADRADGTVSRGQVTGERSSEAFDPAGESTMMRPVSREVAAESTTMRPVSREFEAADATTMRPVSREFIAAQPPVTAQPPIMAQPPSAAQPLGLETDLDGTTQRRGALPPIAGPPPVPAAGPDIPAPRARRRWWIGAAALVALALVGGGVTYAAANHGKDAPSVEPLAAAATTPAPGGTPIPTQAPSSPATASSHPGRIIISSAATERAGKKCYLVRVSGMGTRARTVTMVFRWSDGYGRQSLPVRTPRGGTGPLRHQGKPLCLGVPRLKGHLVYGTTARVSLGSAHTVWHLPTA